MNLQGKYVYVYIQGKLYNAIWQKWTIMDYNKFNKPIKS